MLTASPEKFAAWFNMKYPGVHRLITGRDIKDMTTCGLIGHRQYYSQSEDGETIRALLQYEQLRQKRIQERSKEEKSEPLKCKRYGQPLP